MGTALFMHVRVSTLFRRFFPFYRFFIHPLHYPIPWQYFYISSLHCNNRPFISAVFFLHLSWYLYTTNLSPCVVISRISVLWQTALLRTSNYFPFYLLRFVHSGLLCQPSFYIYQYHFSFPWLTYSSTQKLKVVHSSET